MAKHGHAGLRSGHAAERLAKDMADAAIGGAAQCVSELNGSPVLSRTPSATTTMAKLWACLPQLADMRGDGFKVVRDFRHKDHVGAAGDTGCEGDLAAVTPHHLEDHHPVVACRGGLQPVDRLGRHHDRCVVADRALGAADIVVDRLRDADKGDAPLLSETAEDGKAAVAADADQRVKAEQADRPPITSSERSLRLPSGMG